MQNQNSEEPCNRTSGQKQAAQEMLAFIQECPTQFHATERIRTELESHGYERLWEDEKWKIRQGGAYYVTKNDSTIVAFHVGTKAGADSGFQITASHSDSPAFKIKEHAGLEVKKKYIQLNTEGYGGMLCASWIDRPLSVAGRAVVREGERFVTKLVDIGRDLVLIPGLAIHMNRNANEGTAYNKQKDMLPLFGGQGCETGDFKKLAAASLGVGEADIYGSDLYLYNRQRPFIWGAQEEFLSSPRLDDLECAYASLKGFLSGRPQQAVHVYACFDNEETGSGTKQGAGSSFLSDVLQRINAGLGNTQEDYYRAVARSFLLSADNAHAVHPNYPEKTDETNCVYMNDGIVIKSHAGQKYTSDAVSIALFRAVCERAGVPVQHFANRSDQQGGSTLGNIAAANVPLNAVDIGLAQLAMHSACETAGVKDTWYLVQAVTEFFSVRFSLEKGVLGIMADKER